MIFGGADEATVMILEVVGIQVGLGICVRTLKIKRVLFKKLFTISSKKL